MWKIMAIRSAHLCWTGIQQQTEMHEATCLTKESRSQPVSCFAEEQAAANPR